MDSADSDQNYQGSAVLTVKKSPIFKILKKKERSYSTLKKLNKLLRNKDLDLDVNDPLLDGSYLHYLTQTAKSNDDVSWRMVYAFSNAGMDVNIQNSKGCTALHLAFQRGYTEIGFLLIEALLKVGIDLEIKNQNNKNAFSYMENIQQLKEMYFSHSPSIWQCVQDSAIEDVNRLVNAWVKVNAKKSRKTLLDLAASNTDLLSLLKKNRFNIDYVHAVFAQDPELIKDLMENKNHSSFNPNIAEFCYIFSWFKPVFRNLPKFLLEITFDTKNTEIIKTVLALGADVNFYHSKTGNPFYYLAFEQEYSIFKEDILANANYNVKNYRGQSVLFHIVNLYLLNEEHSYTNELLKDFNSVLNRNPAIIAARDETDLSLYETILALPPVLLSKASEILRLIGKFLLGFIRIKDYDLFQEMIFDAYGLTLMNTPIYDETSNNSLDNSEMLADTTQTLREYLNQSEENKPLIDFFNEYIDFYYNSLVVDFFKAVKMGDTLSLKSIFDLDSKKILTKFKDYSGRSCLHLSILFNRPTIFKFLLQCDTNLIYEVDNLNRTCLHYAMAIKEPKMIEILENLKIDSSIRDSKFLLASEYDNEEVLNDDWFNVKNFREIEIRKVNGAVSNVICFEYSRIQQAIEANDANELENINLNMKNSFISFKDIVFWKSEKSYQAGKPWVPPLEQAMLSRCFLAFQYLLENGVEPQKSSQPVRFIKSAKERRILAARAPTARYDSYKNNRIKSGIRHIDMSLERLREKAEILEMYEIIDILDNFGENSEIIAAANARNDLLSAKKYKNLASNQQKQQSESVMTVASNPSRATKNKSTVSNKSTKSILSNVCSIL